MLSSPIRRLASSSRSCAGSPASRVCNACSRPCSPRSRHSSSRGTGTAVWRLSAASASPRSERRTTSALRFAPQRCGGFSKPAPPEAPPAATPGSPSGGLGLAGWAGRFISIGSDIGFIGFRVYCPVSKEIGGDILDRFDAIAIDDLGDTQQSREEMEVLLTLLADRYEKEERSHYLQLGLQPADQIFKDPMMTMAAVDRLVHHAVIFEFNGDSYRAAANAKPNGVIRDNPSV
ncbi:MAG: ATP-binding protein [Undibacterium sp.]|nr:ATP-binding protein [Opitutaceae bacterium]